MRSRIFEADLAIASDIVSHCQSLASSTRRRKYLRPGGRTVILRGTHVGRAFDAKEVVEG